MGQGPAGCAGARGSWQTVDVVVHGDGVGDGRSGGSRSQAIRRPRGQLCAPRFLLRRLFVKLSRPEHKRDGERWHLHDPDAPRDGEALVRGPLARQLSSERVASAIGDEDPSIVERRGPIGGELQRAGRETWVWAWSAARVERPTRAAACQ